MVRFAGTENGRLFGFLPGYVADAKELPGYAPIPAPTPLDWLRDALTLKHMWAAPNLPWSLIALAFYFAAPYRLGHADALAADAPLSWAFFAARFPLWAALVLGYAAFWHATLYGGLGWARRPMLAARAYNWDKVAHNVFWSVSGVAIWVAFENVFVFLWSTGRLAYLSDADAFSTRAGALRFALGLVLMPLWRDGHFYFAHRLLHYKPMFQQVWFFIVWVCSEFWVFDSHHFCSAYRVCFGPRCTRCTTAIRM
jgi:hypothetical protein